MRRTATPAVVWVLALVAGCSPVAGSPSGSASVSPPSTAASLGPAVITVPSPRPSTTPSRAPSTITAARTTDQVGPIRQLPEGAAPGLSGLAAGPTPGTFYAVNDLTGTSEVLVIRADGSVVGRVPVQGMRAVNAEALSTGPCGSAKCLYIGDIGDNAAGRDDIVIYRIVNAGVVSSGAKAESWRYTYPDGPHNAEAMIALADGSLVLITKPGRRADGTFAPHRIYRGAAGGGELVFISAFTLPPPARPLQSLVVGNVVTDAAYADGRLLLLTYDQVVEYRAPSRTADPATFPGWPHRELPDPPMIQTEGLTIDSTGYLVGSEAGPGGGRSAVAQVDH